MLIFTVMLSVDKSGNLTVVTILSFDMIDGGTVEGKKETENLHDECMLPGVLYYHDV